MLRLVAASLLLSSVFATAQEAIVKHLVPPHYPAEMVKQRIQGDVVASVKLQSDGKVQSVEILRGYPGFQAAVLDSLKQWTFQCLNCSPTSPFEQKITFHFELHTDSCDEKDEDTYSFDLPEHVNIFHPAKCIVTTTD